jgi:hypothetical protein
MKNFRLPTLRDFAFIFLFLLNIVSLAIGYFADNAWFTLLAILLSFIQFYMYGTATSQHAK